MKLRPSALAGAALAASICVAGCGGVPTPQPTLAVHSMTVSDGKRMARQLCNDLASMKHDAAIQAAAVRMAEAEVTTSDQDAILKYAASIVCPREFA